MPETSLQLWNDFTDLTESLRTDAIWEVEYVGKKFYLTTEERDFLEGQLEKGTK